MTDDERIIKLQHEIFELEQMLSVYLESDNYEFTDLSGFTLEQLKEKRDELKRTIEKIKQWHWYFKEKIEEVYQSMFND